MDLFNQIAQLDKQGNLQAVGSSSFISNIVAGTVIDVDDPHQMGRVRVLCPALGDDIDNQDVTSIPWALQLASSAGSINDEDFTRGPNDDQTTKGSVAYGFWTVPQLQSTAIVACLNGDPSQRIYLGSLYDQFTQNTTPHGRFFLQPANNGPDGPFSSDGLPIQPLYDAFDQAFNGNKESPEWKTRVADFLAGAITDKIFNNFALRDVEGFTPDETKFATEVNQHEVNQGYDYNHLAPSEQEDAMSSQVHSWTTPGFQSISMDDRKLNNRMRFRTTTGHQIILDDTNERIYVSPSGGRNWIQMDVDGNIDMYTDNKVNVRSKWDINFTSDKSIRMHAKEGIHMYADQDIRMHSKQSIRQHAVQDLYQTVDNGDVQLNVGGTLYLTSGSNIELSAGSDANITSGGVINEKASSDLVMQANGNLSGLASGNVDWDGSTVNLNGGGAGLASSAGEATTNPSEKDALWTNRVPDHEPWPRTMTADEFTHEPEFTAESDQVGKSERRGPTIERGPYWRR